MLQPVSSFAMDALLCRVDNGNPGQRFPNTFVGGGGCLPSFSQDQFSSPIGSFLACPSAFLTPASSQLSLRPQQQQHGQPLQSWSPGLPLSPLLMEARGGIFNYGGGSAAGLWTTPGITAWLQMRHQVALLFQHHQQDLLDKLPGSCTLPKLEAKSHADHQSDISWFLDPSRLPQLSTKHNVYPHVNDVKTGTDCLSSVEMHPTTATITDLISSPASKQTKHDYSTSGSIADDCSSLSHSPTKKRQRSGFQEGVTVGYTYDAFFVSDGRSKRRNLSHNTSNSLEVEVVNESPVPTPAPSEVVTPTEGRQRYTCSECGKDYATSSNLSRHKQTHRSLDSKLAKKCPHCDKIYVSMPALSMHVLTHDLKHQCNVCGKAFSRPWLLQGHLRAHTGEKPYGCAHCGRAFADRSNLRAHMQTHSMMKQFECEKCGKSFALKSYLNKHVEAACMAFPNSSLNSPTYSVSDCVKAIENDTFC